MKCADCGQESDTLVKVKVGKKTLKLCEDCADIRREQAEVSDDAESAMRGVMEYKGRR